jgi:hypothetical protein
LVLHKPPSFALTTTVARPAFKPRSFTTTAPEASVEERSPLTTWSTPPGVTVAEVGRCWTGPVLGPAEHARLTAKVKLSPAK